MAVRSGLRAPLGSLGLVHLSPLPSLTAARTYMAAWDTHGGGNAQFEHPRGECGRLSERPSGGLRPSRHGGVRMVRRPHGRCVEATRTLSLGCPRSSGSCWGLCWAPGSTAGPWATRALGLRGHVGSAHGKRDVLLRPRRGGGEAVEEADRASLDTAPRPRSVGSGRGAMRSIGVVLIPRGSR